MTVLSFDDMLPNAIVLHRPASLRDAICQRGFTDDLTRPQLPEQLLPRNDPITVGNEVREELKDLGLDLYGLTRPA
jgi:hypothetical protein